MPYITDRIIEGSAMTMISTTTLGDGRSAGVGPVVIAALVGRPVACKVGK